MLKLFLFLFSAGLSLAQNFSKPNGLVNDFAQILSPTYRAKLETQLQSFQSVAQIAFVSIDSLNQDSIENYAQKLFRAWGIGDSKQDNGVLFLVSKQERQVRIEVGYGLEPYLPDGLAGEILRTQIIPKFKQNDFDGGVADGLQQIQKILTAKIPYQDPPKTASPAIYPVIKYLVSNPEAILILLTIIIYFVAYMARTKSIWAGAIVGFILGLIVFGLTTALISGVLGLILDLILSKNYQYFKLHNQKTNWFSTHGGFWGNGGSGFWKSSGGGFGGFGGGSSGGGGASGRW